MTTIEAYPSDYVERTLYSREAEEAVLGACLINPDMFPLINAHLGAQHFYIHRNRWIWQAMQRLRDRQEPIDLITVACELGEARLKELGGNAHLTALTNGVGFTFNAESYAHTVRNYAVLRDVVAAAQNTVADAYRDGATAAAVVARADQGVRSASMGLPTGNTQPLSDVLAEIRALTEERLRTGQAPGISTGFPGLDAKLGGGLREGELTIVAAEPGGGKTSFLTMVAAHVSKSRRVRYHTLEMTAQELANRMLAQASHLNSQAIETRRLNDAELDQLEAASQELGARLLDIDDAVPTTVPDVAAKCLRAQMERGPHLVVIDPAGLIHAPGESEFDQSRSLSRDLKVLAKELHAPILVAHQFNRRRTEQETPKIENLRGSGTWEQDADNVLLLYPHGESRRPGYQPYHLEIAKQRNGPTGYVHLVFRAETTEFVEAKRGAEEG